MLGGYLFRVSADLDPYFKYKGSVFKFAAFEGWYIVVTEPRLVDEYLRMPEYMLSASGTAAVTMQLDYTIGKRVARNQYHNDVVRSLLTRHLDSLYPDLYDEIVASFGTHIGDNNGTQCSIFL